MTSPATLSGPPANPHGRRDGQGGFCPALIPVTGLRLLYSFSLRIEAYEWLGKRPSEEDIPIEILLKFMLNTIKY